MVTTLNSARVSRGDSGATQQVWFLRAVANYNDASIASGVIHGSLPAGALIIGTDVYAATSFNANSTNVFTVGTNSTQLDNIVGSGDFTEGTQLAVTYDIKPTGTALGPIASESPVYLKYTQTGGTVATSGQAVVVIKYVLATGTTGSATSDN